MSLGNRSALFIGVTILAGVLGCEGSAVAPEPSPLPDVRAAAVPNPSFEPFDFTIPGCAEDVNVSGTFHETVKFRVGPNGKSLFRFHINAKGTGVGQTSGTTYQWNDRLFDITNIAPEGATSFILNDYGRLIGQGGAPDLHVRIRIKVTIDANGEVRVDDFHAEEICR